MIEFLVGFVVGGLFVGFTAWSFWDGFITEIRRVAQQRNINLTAAQRKALYANPLDIFE